MAGLSLGWQHLKQEDGNAVGAGEQGGLGGALGGPLARAGEAKRELAGGFWET